MPSPTKQAIKEALARGELTFSRVEQVTRKVDDFEPKVKIIDQPNYIPKKTTVDDFVKHYRRRYEFLKNILLNHTNTADAVSISKLSMAGPRQATIIAMINDIQQFPGGAVKLVLEDESGSINAVISGKRNPDLLIQADMLALDEVLAFKGTASGKTFFVDELIWPDVTTRTPKKSSDEVYAAFSGDLHAGSRTFLPDELNRFIAWLRGEQGNEKQRDIAKRTKYVFIQGDVVDGVGIYQNQEKELKITDINNQYDYVSKFVAQIPSDKIIIICPGNHDAMRLAEPQPPLEKSYAAKLYELPNVMCVSNPCTVNIHNVGGEPGYNVLMYHGYSFDYFLEKVKGLREAGGYSAPDKLIEFLLKRRHLAPSSESAPHVPMYDDAMLIKNVPDIFTTGHIHKVKLSSYRNIVTIASSCWQKNTSFQDRVGLMAEPAKVPIINLKTQKAQVLDFN